MVSVDRGSSSAGNMAWAMLALVRAWERLGEHDYLEAAERLGQWLVDNTLDERGASGYTGGYSGDGVRFSWKATEHNVDVYAAFMNLYRATEETTWQGHALTARRFVDSMWNDEQGFFWTGATDDGVTVNRSPVPEDAQSWTLLAWESTSGMGGRWLGPSPSFSIRLVLRRMTSVVTASALLGLAVGGRARPIWPWPGRLLETQSDLARCCRTCALRLYRCPIRRGLPYRPLQAATQSQGMDGATRPALPTSPLPHGISSPRWRITRSGEQAPPSLCLGWAVSMRLS